MRANAYRLMEIVAWPALVWCALESTVRVSAGAFDGLAATSLTGGMAALTVWACRLRSRHLAPVER